MSNEISQLKEYAEKHHKNKIVPEYYVTEKMVPGTKEFTSLCKFDGNKATGTAKSKKEARRLSAKNMLLILYEKDSSKFTSPPLKTEEEIVESNKLGDFDHSKLEIYLDEYLENREKDHGTFRRIFVGNIPESTEETLFEVNDQDADVKSLKSNTLEMLKMTGINEVNLGNACRIFNSIIKETKQTHYAEFLETAKNNKYAVVIKLNLNLFTAGGIGDTPQKAIQAACKNAIELLYLSNM